MKKQVYVRPDDIFVSWAGTAKKGYTLSVYRKHQGKRIGLNGHGKHFTSYDTCKAWAIEQGYLVPFASRH